MAMIPCECPNFGNRVLHDNIENAFLVPDGSPNARCLTYTSIHCHVVLGVQVDHRARPRSRAKPAATTS